MQQRFHPSAMRYRVAFERANLTRSASGAEVKGWSEVASVRAAITWGTGKETLKDRAVTPEIDHVVTIRYLIGLSSAWRIRFDDLREKTTRYFDIRAIQPVGPARRYQELHVHELVGREIHT